MQPCTNAISHLEVCVRMCVCVRACLCKFSLIIYQPLYYVIEVREKQYQHDFLLVDKLAYVHAHIYTRVVFDVLKRLNAQNKYL